MLAKRPQLIVGLMLLILAPTLWAGPKIQHWETGNGARILFVEAPELPMVDVRVVFDAGSARDEKKPGLASLTAALLTEGAGEWNANQIAERLEAVGADLNAGSERDMAWVSARTLTEPRALETTLETLTAIIAQPRFEKADFNRLREAMQVGLRQSEQSPGTVASRAFFAELFKGHPYASFPGGTRESLDTMTRADVVAMHKRFYVARNAVVAIVGALDRAGAEKLAARITAGLPAGQPAPALPPAPMPAEGRSIHIPFPSAQSHILMGLPGMRRGDPDYFPLYVGNHILGGSGLVSLLSEEVREKRGLSYSVYSYFHPMRQPGPFTVGAQTKNARSDEALKVMRKTLQRFIDEGPSRKQLTAARQNITGGFPLRIASNRNIVQYLAMLGFYNLPLDYLDTFVTRVNAVTREQIRDAFQQRVHPGKFITLMVGQATTKEEQ